MLFKLKHLKDTETSIKSTSFYEISMKQFEVDGSIFNMEKKMTASIVAKIGRNKFNDLLNKSIKDIRDITCRHPSCSNTCEIRYERKKLIVSNFCSKECFMDREERHKKNRLAHQAYCRYCGELFQHTSKVNKLHKKGSVVCYSDDCRKKSREDQNKAIKDTHWTKKENVAKIMQKRVKSRIISEEKRKKEQGPRIPWNKDKTGIYSKETIEKIRDAALRQMSNPSYKKTQIEKAIEELLIELNIKYKYSFILEKRQYDFLLLDHNIIIECDGDYWHANPKFYGEEDGKKKLTERQQMKRKDDLVKNRIAKYNNYIILRFWEWDINNQITNVKEKITMEIKKK